MCFNFWLVSRLNGIIEEILPIFVETVCGVNGISVSSVVCVSSTTEKHFTIPTLSTTSLSIQYQITKIKYEKKKKCKKKHFARYGFGCTVEPDSCC